MPALYAKRFWALQRAYEAAEDPTFKALWLAKQKELFAALRPLRMLCPKENPRHVTH